MKRLMMVFALAVLAAPAGAATMRTASCQEHEATVDADAAAVAARLPAGFTAVTDSLTGAPLVVAHAFRCAKVTIGRHTGRAVFANLGILIESPNGVGCASGAPVVGAIKGDVPPACNWYPLLWLADRPWVAGWLHGTVRRDLTFSLGAVDAAQGGAPFHFDAPGTFAIDDTSRSRPGEISVRGAYWTTTGSISIASDDISAGDATGTLRAESPEVAALLGAGERSFVPGYDAVAAVNWRHLTYTKHPG
jgi:hypothetical protein